jgi:hypothetical protein
MYIRFTYFMFRRLYIRRKRDFSGYRTGLAGLSIKRDFLKDPLNLTPCSSLIKTLSDKSKVENKRYGLQPYILRSSVNIYCEIKQL